jgi:hypothetical protein
VNNQRIELIIAKLQLMLTKQNSTWADYDYIIQLLHQDHRETSKDKIIENNKLISDGHYTDFCYPKCGSYMFGSSLTKDGWIRHCHGNEKWKCDYSAPEYEDHKHFKKFVKKTKNLLLMKW